MNPAVECAAVNLPTPCREVAVTRRHCSLRLGAVIAGAFALTGCGLGTAHRVPGTDMALPATSYADKIVAALARPCQVAQAPVPSLLPTPEHVKQSCPTSADTAIGQPGTVGRGPTRVP
jgi:hypothetical protein